ncbi:VPS10 domain-containing protein [Robiginitalea marina]|uniref:Glycosyl hydrolase n=1 Tax=Robiginitalea marina TaxID=2954105 RepID=A0ABT1AWC5_9FLAO|nr:glycosyl hydrolase [Robiginitalea marina]MCO5723508.1 glycosyl hydrolase [Robiginitalea marina]
MNILRPFLLIFVCISGAFTLQSQWTDSIFSGLEFRSLGPAFTSGRIADIAIHPGDESLWYVAVGSGGVWKTENAGTTWTPVFDQQGSYSVGCVTLDPSAPSTVWVGTGENVGGRHVGFGDGIYVSRDGGATWTNKGLKESEHISKIIIHPDNPDILWVAAQGPLWSRGGQRGVYKTTDGGTTWKRTLGDDAWMGATDLLQDPRDPDVLYAASWERHRTVAAYMGGGPNSGIHKSTDGGETWQKLTRGIPGSNLGKIGLAMNPFNPDQVYAAIELDRLKGGVFMSEDGGVSWTKQSDAVSGGTGPHYYQELYASPHVEGRLYLMNYIVQISDDHGRTFRSMNEDKKHVDSHAMAFRPSDPDYVIFGTDGGLYESFDHTKTWRFVRNLPLAQYYKVAVDDAEPFYHIYGGTQDNGSHGGPSRTRNSGGIFNSDWWVTLGADGHQSATEPGNPDITYGEFQQGWLWRIDQTTREIVFIQPQPGPGEPYERFNWDAPILVSPHKPSRLYFASQRVWRSEDRGDSWTPVSGDLTKNQERLALPIMGGTQSWDNPWDVNAMSNYNTITSLSESPLREGLLYAGTDDGIIQVSEDGGGTWRKVELGSIKGVPATAFVNDIRADLFEEGTVYAALDNHKNGDYKPYLIKSTDRGRSWTLINGNLPGRLLTWRLVQDHKDPKLLFLASEFGVYFTRDGGNRWIQLKGGLPTIAMRDLTIQRREDDLVVASFGRGFYVLDDLSPLRSFSEETARAEATLFPVKKAYWYVQQEETYGQGHSEYAGENPPFGAVFTYYLTQDYPSLKEERQQREKKVTNKVFPGWEALEKESLEKGPRILLTVKDASGNLVRVVEGTKKKGFNRVSWPLDVADRTGVSLEPPGGASGNDFGFRIMATPGTYSVSLSKWENGVETVLAGPESFEVAPLAEGALKRASYQEIASFRSTYESFIQDLHATQNVLETSQKKTGAMQRALERASRVSPDLYKELYDLQQQLQALDSRLNGNKAKAEIGERNAPNPENGAFVGMVALSSSTYGPTPTHRKALQVAQGQLEAIKGELRALEARFPALEKGLKDAGAPWIEGQGLLKSE